MRGALGADYPSRSEGDAERDISSLGAMGLGGVFFGKLFRRRPKSGCLVNYQILCFLTHIRDLDMLLAGIDS